MNTPDSSTPQAPALPAEVGAPRRISETPPVFPCWLWLSCPWEPMVPPCWLPFSKMPVGGLDKDEVTHWHPDQPTAPTCVPGQEWDECGPLPPSSPQAALGVREEVKRILDDCLLPLPFSGEETIHPVVRESMSARILRALDRFWAPSSPYSHSATADELARWREAFGAKEGETVEQCRRIWQVALDEQDLLRARVRREGEGEVKTYPDFFFVFDVESIGLHGEGYAVGWVVVRRDWQTMGEGRMACLPGAASGKAYDRDWVSANIPHIEPTHNTPIALRDAFWSLWMLWKAKGAVLVSDCGWPVEARFLARCIEDNDSRCWDGPYPLHDLASVFLANGEDPLAIRERHNSEHPKHDPLADARQSARLLLEQLNLPRP